MFGYGVCVYGGNVNNIWFGMFDIGFINDLFMGGIIYMVLLYGMIIVLLMVCYKKFGKVVCDSKIFLVFGVVLLIVNYKGEVVCSGMVLMVIIFLGYLFLIELKIEEKKW